MKHTFNLPSWSQALWRVAAGAVVLSLAACGGGGGNAGSSGFGGGSSGGGTASPTLKLALSTSSINAATPATVTAKLKDASGNAVAGQVVTFTVSRSLGRTNVATALSNAAGDAVAVLTPASNTSAGADEITATATLSGVRVSDTAGFSVQSTSVTLSSFTADPATPTLSAYGQTTLTIGLTGASVNAPASLTITSACVNAGKASLSPASTTATSSTVTLQYRDSGCGAVQSADVLQVVIGGTAETRSLSLPIASPAVSSLAFVSASPELIFLKGSGFVEASNVTFEVRDVNNSPLPNRNVTLSLLTTTGGVTMDGGTVPVTRTSDALGRVTVRVNSGTVPTPVRISAALVAGSSTISTVSSNLSVAVGLPTQVNFSLSQGRKNIEGYDIDGTLNTYQIIAADRNGNPVPAGTAINFVTEGGQIQASRQITIDGSGIARTVANLASADPRPVDGRVTVTAYALGEESFIDLNGNNQYDGPGSPSLAALGSAVQAAGEPFQDLGNVFKDRNFDGAFDSTTDEYVPLNINNAKACMAPPTLYLLDPSVPSIPASCDSIWSGAGQVFVRRATETVFSTSAARPLWASTGGLSNSCKTATLQVGPSPSNTASFVLAGGDAWYGGASGSLNFIVADANPGSIPRSLLPRLNPMAAGTQITASTPTPGLTVSVGGGSPVPSTTEATSATIAYAFTDPAVSTGIAFITFTSPSGVGTTISVNIIQGSRPTACPL